MRSTFLAASVSLLITASSCGSPPRQAIPTKSSGASGADDSRPAGSRIAFRGNRALSTPELTTAIAGDEEAKTSLLLTTLLAAYFESGYIVAKISSATNARTGTRTFLIQEGPRFRIGRVAFTDSNGEGRDEVGRRQDLQQTIRVSRGEWFRRSAVVNSIKALYARYQRGGYPRVNITPLTNIDPRSRSVDVTFQIERGPRTP